MSVNEYLEFIIEQTGKPKDEVQKLLRAKVKDEKVNALNAYKLLCKEFELDFEKKTKINKNNKREELIMVEEDKKEAPNELEEQIINKESMTLAPIEASGMVSADTIKYPSEAEILLKIKRLQFVKQNLITKNDWEIIKGKKHLNRSAVQKYINAFGISIDILEGPVFLEREAVLEGYSNNPLKDRGVRYRVKAIAPTGQYVMSDGTKFKSEFWSKDFRNFGSYNEHNLTTTALTRAIKHAVLDLIGYGEEEKED